MKLWFKVFISALFLVIAAINATALVGFEPTLSGATNQRFNQLSYTHHMARQKGLEPPTYCLEGSCSIQLSYRTIICIVYIAKAMSLHYMGSSG